jgi:hypothetical protein
MTKRPYRIRRCALALALYAVALAPALAADPLCEQLKSVTQPLRTTPFHMYMTQTQTYTNSAMASAAGQMGMTGPRQSEEISTGKNIYVLTRGKWIDMQTSFAAMEQDKDDDPDTKKALDESKCQALPDETVDGQAAKVYQRSTPGLNMVVKVWISKSTKLPIRTSTSNDEGGMKMSSVARYEYGNVQAPAQTTTMKQMVESRRAH